MQVIPYRKVPVTSVDSDNNWKPGNSYYMYWVNFENYLLQC